MNANRVEIHASRIKHGMLGIACIYVAYLGWHVWQYPGDAATLGVMMMAVGAICTVGMFWMGFATAPALVIDASGIQCRRPNFGLIPWSAIQGIGLGRANLQRNALIIAYDPDALPPEQVERMKREVGSMLMSPNIARYQGKMAGFPTVVVSTALLAVRPAELERILTENVHYEDRK